MNYPYSEQNRLDSPHNYMYAPYGGRDFLAAYVADRSWRLNALLRAQPRRVRGGTLKHSLSDAARSLASSTVPKEFLLEERTELNRLLAALLGVLAAGDVDAARPWLTRVIQRFEVTKSLFAVYAPGFRKGEGEARDPARYAELALCVALAHLLSGNLQYLSTLLKLVDVLLSLDSATLHSACAPELLELLVAAELDAVRTLAGDHSVQIDGS